MDVIQTETGQPTLGTEIALRCERCPGVALRVPILLATPSGIDQVGAYQMCLDCGHSPASPGAVLEDFDSRNWHLTLDEPTMLPCSACTHQRLRYVAVHATWSGRLHPIGAWAICTRCRHIP